MKGQCIQKDIILNRGIVRKSDFGLKGVRESRTSHIYFVVFLFSMVKIENRKHLTSSVTANVMYQII